MEIQTLEHEDPRLRFTGAASFYDRYRPSYPRALVDWISARTGIEPPAEIADIGCGTGISTRLLASRGFHVTGIEPNEAMLSHANGGARYVHGEAEATGLEDSSVELVVSAQALHWFDLEPALAEWKRILAPHGWCAAFWNKKEKGAFRDEFNELRRKHARSAHEDETRAKHAKRAVIAALRSSPHVAGLRERTFVHRHVLDRCSFMGRVFTGSYFAHDATRLPSFERDFQALFDRHQKRGVLEIRLRALAIIWRLQLRRNDPSVHRTDG